MRTSKLYEYNGKQYTLADLSRICGYNPKTILARIQRGYSVKQAVEAPIDLSTVSPCAPISKVEAAKMRRVFTWDCPD